MFNQEDLKKDNDLLINKYGVLPDPNFNAEKNNKIIEQSIKKAELLRSNKIRKYSDTVRDRANAVSFFLEHVNNGKNNNIENYFGKRELARLRGEEIIENLKSRIIRDAKTQ